MKKTYIAILLTCLTSLVNSHVVAAEKASEIKAEQRDIALEIFELRKTLIQSDVKLMELHKEKLKLHRLISERISGDPKMAKLLDKAIKLQAKLDELNKPVDTITTETKALDKVKEVVKSPEKVEAVVKKAKELAEPVFKSRNANKRTSPKVIDKTADAHIENDGLSYE